MDFLHCCDLGVTSDWMGSLLWYIQEYKVGGNGRLERCCKIFSTIQAFYKRTDAENRLPKLLPTMLRAEEKGKRKCPKLRAKAGEARSLVPCCLELARQYLDPADPAEHSMIQGCERLCDVYANLSSAVWNHEDFQNACKRFLMLFLALEKHFLETKLFRVKPKAHQLVELGRDGSNPSLSWTYRDESFGHTLALLAKRRGGKFSMAAVSKAVLLRFLSANAVPRLDERR